MKQLLKELCAIPGACAHEYNVISYIRESLKGYVDSCQVDGIGDLIVSKKGAFDGPTLVISAHADEVGGMVSKIEPSGFIRFELFGGQDNRTLPLMPVIISTDKGPVKGHIGWQSAHMRRMADASRVYNYTELYIDIGAGSAAQAVEMGVSLGDQITWDSPVEDFGPDMLVGHAFDDRAGCALLINMFKTVDFSKVHGTVYGIFSVREEVGMVGAGVAANVIASQTHVDVALAVDTTPARDTLEGPVMDRSMIMGAGPTIKIADMSYAASVKVHKKLEQLARAANIPFQKEVFMFIGTDAGNIYKAAYGIPTGGISIVSRNAHSARELIHKKDMENGAKLLAEFVYALNDKDEFKFC